jgi:hypothetical protein
MDPVSAIETDDGTVVVVVLAMLVVTLSKGGEVLSTREMEERVRIEVLVWGFSG